MANEVRVGLDIHGEKKVKDGLKGVGDQATKTGDQLEEMGDQATEAAKSTDKAGDSFKDTGRDTEFLTDKVEELSEAYQKLLRELNSTGDTSIEKDIRKAQRDLRKYERFAKELAPDLADAGTDAGTSFGQKFLNAAGGVVASGNPYIMGAITNIGIAAAPLLGGAIGAAVLGGVGTGGIIGGIALASQDARVAAAGKRTGDTLVREFQQAARPFVDPVLNSLEKVGRARWADKLAPSFDKLASRVEPLTDGLMGLVDRALPGVEDAIEGAGPLLDVLAQELPDVGEAIGDMLSRIADDPQGAIDAMHTLLGLVEATAHATGFIVDGLQNTYEAITDVQVALGIFERPTIETWSKRSSGSVREFGESAEEAEERIRGLDAAIAELLDQEYGLQSAQDEAADAFARLTEQIKDQKEAGEKGAGSLEGYSQAARDNRTAMTALVGKYGEIVSKSAETGTNVAGLREQFIKQAEKAGVARKELQKYLAVLDEIIARRIGGINSGGQGGAAFSTLGTGGHTQAGRTYVVGEHGPEIWSESAPGYMTNSVDTRTVMSGASGGSAGGMAGGGVASFSFAATVREPDSALGKALAAFMVPYIQIEVMNQGGDVIAVLGAPTG